jgi:hypothetical protein
MADHANIAAAVAAGYSETVDDRGASFPNASTRFEVTLEKCVTEGSSSGSMQRAFGQDTSQDIAKAVAVTGETPRLLLALAHVRLSLPEGE